MLPGGYFSHGVLELTLDSQEHISLNEDLCTWRVAGKAAEMLRQDWEDTNYALTVKNYLQMFCVDEFLQVLDHGKDYLLRTGKDKNCPIPSETRAAGPEHLSSAGSSWNTNSVLH